MKRQVTRRAGAGSAWLQGRLCKPGKPLVLELPPTIEKSLPATGWEISDPPAAKPAKKPAAKPAKTKEGGS